MQDCSTVVQRIPAASIVAGDNDRTEFEPNALRELAESIAAHGLAQPITVRPIYQDGESLEIYQIICGERRFRACQLLGWDLIPVIVQEMDDETASAVMLAENTARADLNPMEEASAYARRQIRFGWSVKDIADRAGVSTVRVLFRLKLLRLQEDIQSLVRTGNLPMGYAQVLADAGLDTNYQFRALRALQQNRTATPTWFRQTVNQMAEVQQQGALLEEEILESPVLDMTAEEIAPEPPHPQTDTPPSVGDTPREIIASQVSFWEAAAAEWAERGKSFKRQECEAAAAALRSVLGAI